VWRSGSTNVWRIGVNSAARSAAGTSEALNVDIRSFCEEKEKPINIGDRKRGCVRAEKEESTNQFR
jgi:hypothetical protein